TNVTVFDELVELLQTRTPIPSLLTFPEHAVELSSYDFPSDQLTDERMASALSDERIAYLRKIVSGASSGEGVIEYSLEGDVGAAKDVGTADLLLSNAVMEHVSDLSATYGAIWRMLRSGGYASHQIDFRS